MKRVFTALAKDVLVPLGLTAAASAGHVAIQKKMFELGMATSIISNKEMDDIIKILNTIEESAY